MDRTAYNASFWRTVVALCLLLSVSGFMNISVFPLFDQVFTYARDISVLANAVCLVCLAFVAAFRSSSLNFKLFNMASVACLFAGSLGLVAALVFSLPVLLVVSSGLLAAARGWVIVVVGVSLTRFDASIIAQIVTIACLGNCACIYIAWFAPTIVGVGCFLLAPAFALLFSCKLSSGVFSEVRLAESPAHIAITQPSSFLTLGSQLFVCIFLFRIAFGFSLRFGEVGGVPIADFFSIVPVAILAFATVASAGKLMKSDFLAQVSVLFVLAGFFAFTISAPWASVAGVSLLSCGSVLFDVVCWVVLAAAGARNLRSSVATIAWGRGLSSIGTIIGASLGVWSGMEASSHPIAMQVVAGLLIMSFAAYSLIGLKEFSFIDTINGVTKVVDELPSSVREASRATFEQACESIASRCSLTPREREVFEMLARGRDSFYIQEQLTVSRNTVKAHVKHIYAKLDIHAHQDLLDMVEQEMSSGDSLPLSAES